MLERYKFILGVECLILFYVWCVLYSLFVLKYFKSLLDQNARQNIIFMCDYSFICLKLSYIFFANDLG